MARQGANPPHDTTAQRPRGTARASTSTAHRARRNTATRPAAHPQLHAAARQDRAHQQPSPEAISKKELHRNDTPGGNSSEQPPQQRQQRGRPGGRGCMQGACGPRAGQHRRAGRDVHTATPSQRHCRPGARSCPPAAPLRHAVVLAASAAADGSRADHRRRCPRREGRSSRGSHNPSELHRLSSRYATRRSARRRRHRRAAAAAGRSTAAADRLSPGTARRGVGGGGMRGEEGGGARPQAARRGGGRN